LVTQKPEALPPKQHCRAIENDSSDRGKEENEKHATKKNYLVAGELEKWT
jgi:hypothetical protein